VGAEGTENLVWLAVSVAGILETVQEPADGLANGADLALFVPRCSPHVFAGPGVNFVEFGLGFVSLSLDYGGVTEYGLAL
jgi:hypothetical protein